MFNPRFLTIALVAGTAVTSLAQTSDVALRADFAGRVQAYAQLRDRVAATVPPLRTTPDAGAIRHASDALASAVQQARASARPGDIFSTEIAQMFRRDIGSICDNDYAALIALVNEEREGPLPAAVLHGRWPVGVPLPTMPPDLLAAVPPLPPGLQYRFMSGALVLLDIDANLIVDFVPRAIPATTSH